MSQKESSELKKLRTLWATGNATKKQMLRCMELDRKERAEDSAARKQGSAL
ncbi:hypothetical protein PQR05_29455 [Paraburkholderia sediminicola]|uniref:hypothetical protein n=1 Tax=Paraburkholderia sediminicola TaxID=458836 RepID=UPI0038B7AAC0